MLHTNQQMKNQQLSIKWNQEPISCYQKLDPDADLMHWKLPRLAADDRVNNWLDAWYPELVFACLS